MLTEKIFDVVSGTLVIIAVILLSFAGNYVDNIIRCKEFIWTCLFWGLVLASTWIFILYRSKRAYFTGDETRKKAILGQFFSIVVIVLFISFYLNYQTGKNKTYIKKGILVKKTKNTMYHTPYAFLNIDNNEERFTPRVSRWDKMQIGDTLSLTVGSGILKYEYIYDFAQDHEYQNE